MKIALGQFSVERGAPEANLEQIKDLAEEAGADGAEALFLPEMATTGFDWSKNVKLLDAASEHHKSLAGMASKAGLAICGSFLEKTENNRPANTFFFFDANGHVAAKYRKAHLFTLFHEERHVEAGNEIVVADTVLGRLGCSICYDVRFPELFRKCMLKGATIQVLPAAFPHPRLEHWRTFVRARALENQCFFIATNQCGREGHGGDVGSICYFGHSTVVDPWGNTLFEADESPGLHFVELDLELAEKARGKLTALKDRRPELYE